MRQGHARARAVYIATLIASSAARSPLLPLIAARSPRAARTHRTAVSGTGVGGTDARADSDTDSGGDATSAAASEQAAGARRRQADSDGRRHRRKLDRALDAVLTVCASNTRGRPVLNARSLGDLQHVVRQLDVRLNGKQAQQGAGGGREADTAVAFVRNLSEHFSAAQRASRGANQQLRSAVIQIGGAGISDRGIGRLLSVGRKTAATCRRRRINRQFLGMDSTRQFAFVPSASLASKRDLTLVSAFWHRVCRENPGRVMRTRIRQADGKARLDATREWKDTPAGCTWNAGEIAVHDKLNKQYLVACQVVIHDSIEDLFRAWGTSEERKRHEAASGGTIGLTLFREARPYCCVPVKPNERTFYVLDWMTRKSASLSA